MSDLNITPREQELIDSFSEAARQHPLVRDEHGALRFVQTVERYKGDIADSWHTLAVGQWTDERLLEFYRQIGYSIGGYAEIIESLV